LNEILSSSISNSSNYSTTDGNGPQLIENESILVFDTNAWLSDPKCIAKLVKTGKYQIVIPLAGESFLSCFRSFFTLSSDLFFLFFSFSLSLF